MISKTVYDTEKAALIAQNAVGAFGDKDGYEESLYQTEDGKFFLYTFGGTESKYPEEKITRMSAAKAEEWRKNNM